MTVAVTESRVGRPRTPLELADRQALIRIATLAANVLSSLRRLNRGQSDSERTLRQWLTEDGVQFTTNDLAPALALLDACGKIGRGPEKGNSPRAGWLVTAPDEPVWTSAVPGTGEAVEDAIAAAADPDIGPNTQDATASPTSPADALAIAILKAFAGGRGYQGNRALCGNESVLREWLHSDGVIFDEADLPAALTKLETATLPGFERSRLLRGSALHRSYPITAKPLPARAMQLTTLHPMDATTYEPADIEPYVT